MNVYQRKIALRVLGAHAAVILFFMMVAGLKGCFRPKPKPEIVTFIEFGAPPPAVQVEEVPDEPDPPPSEPVVEEAPPPPEPRHIPEPPKEKKKLTPKKVTPKKDPPKPKWKPVDPKDIDISKSKKITPKETKPAVSEQEIKKALEGISKASPTPSQLPVGNPNANAAYISQVGSYFDRYWNHPPSATPAESMVVRIHFLKSGAITKRTPIQRSGDSAFDDSVMAAVNAVNSVPEPPSGFPYEYVEVEFRIRN
ncbi:hypothetical protein PDESU_04394 [Pontiella desulfatans]|uniref:TonB C-terminal domain-containing protein n=1 Tax=Pontiella desulfatans TaxID=2750659 RepID=A0A6C2U7U7_PONDE|nr:TonB family protein [Pontiella desulfatans]VGO15807.1 hypothetical protein PDESU_04394 [Pontiella desulfatans]